MGPKIRIVGGIILWVLAALSFVVLVRDISMVARLSGAPSSNLIVLIRSYRQGAALFEGVAALVFLVPAYLLTRTHLQRTKPRIALMVGVVVAIALGINASYALMAEIPALR